MLFVSTIFISCEKNTSDSDNPNGGTLQERIITDTAYGAEAKQKMDIYLPAKRTAKTKVVVLVHGGGWQSGDKSELNGYKDLLRSKWPEAAVVNINYRLASNILNIHHEEIMNDIKATVNFILNNKNNFSISDTLVMVGASAGAHLAMMYTYKYNSGNHVKCVANFFGPAKLSDWDWYNSFNLWLGVATKDVMIQYMGEPWNQTLYDNNSPHVIATAQSKPTIIFHGTIDVIVPLYQSQWLNARLNELGVPHEYHEYILDGHGFNATNTNDAITKTVAFFKKHIQ